MKKTKYTSANDPLLNPENHAVLLIDHQYLQLLTVRSHDGATVVNNVTALAKAAKLFNVPALKEIQDVFPEQKPIDRTTLNSWEDQRVVDWVKGTGRKKLVIAGLWTEICLTFPVLSALAEGYEVYIVTDASGGATPEAHDMAVQRMIQAGAMPLTVIAYVSELQRDWGREATVPQVIDIFERHAGAFGQGLRWEWQLLALKEGTR
jgi:nicotinamidase-related amidase